MPLEGKHRRRALDGTLGHLGFVWGICFGSARCCLCSRRGAQTTYVYDHSLAGWSRVWGSPGFEGMMGSLSPAEHQNFILRQHLALSLVLHEPLPSSPLINPSPLARDTHTHTLYQAFLDLL